MDSFEREKIFLSAARLKLRENTPEAFINPYSKMTHEELSRLAWYQQ